MNEKITHSDPEWRAKLSPQQFHVLRMKGTDRPSSDGYTDLEAKGMYACAGCGSMLFDSVAKYHSGSGWPSFDGPLSSDVVVEHIDSEHGMTRTEVVCSTCEGHLGHVFPDGPRQTTGLRYCMNTSALRFIPK